MSCSCLLCLDRKFFLSLCRASSVRLALFIEDTVLHRYFSLFEAWQMRHLDLRFLGAMRRHRGP